MRRAVKHFTCRKCGKVNPDYLTFGVGRDKYYCLNHIPRWVQFRMWWHERRTAW
ncbi:MAG TPA: hypothetical protein VFR23_04230 [Jiangellaceae bacterium]|nr:hypothetical protein [Jiangellaceae bacterium]